MTTTTQLAALAAAVATSTAIGALTATLAHQRRDTAQRARYARIERILARHTAELDRRAATRHDLPPLERSHTPRRPYSTNGAHR